jgi:hypothetical protein
MTGVCPYVFILSVVFVYFPAIWWSHCESRRPDLDAHANDLFALQRKKLSFLRDI